MHPETTRITLPPPQMIRSHRPKVPRWMWIALIVVSLLLGAGGGWYLGLKQGDPVTVTGTVDTGAADEAAAKKVTEARLAVASGDWVMARRLFEEARDLDPDNADALASLPLISQRLDEARGTVTVTTDPEGAIVKLGAFKEQTSPATFTGVTLGEHELVAIMPGFDTITRRILIESEEPKRIDDIVLARSSGRLEVVSEPEGADFKLIRTRERVPEALVQIGKTPARIERLDPGEYQVLMAVKGWPEHSQFVLVENNRDTSVSAVFAKGGLNITSDPAGAAVWIQAGEAPPSEVGKTPLSLADLPVGKHRLELRYADWAPISRAVEVSGGSTQDLEFSWERALVSFTSDPPGAEVYLGDKPLGRGAQKTPFQVELPEGDYQFSARHSKLDPVSLSTYIDADTGSNGVDFHFNYGSVTLSSDPPGAAVVSGGMPMGRTPLTLAVVPPGNYTFELSKEQHRATSVSGSVEAGGSLNFTATLSYDSAPVASRDFKNSLGQQLAWIGPLNGWAGAYEVTQAEYERLSGTNPSYFKAPNHPVETVTWYEAVKFCEALTVQERALGTLPAGYRYRLPTDEEWSRLVGGQKLDAAISSLFERQKSSAPVGSLAANEYGLYDIRGNVWEWVNDWYSQTILNRIQKEGSTATAEWVGTDRKVLRGGAWNRSSEFDLAVANRMAARPSAEDRYDVGFRVVLMRD
jgi:formylglycine-generating enzyme required for sulfatase activity